MVYFMRQEYLKRVLEYDPDTGVFIWVRITKGVNVGTRAGSINDQGYRTIMIDGANYPAARLAWLYMTGSFPKNDVDHINRTRNDDRWINLREATRSQNMMNGTLRIDNKTGQRGVSWHKAGQKWHAQIRVNNKIFYLGLFSSFEDAKEARLKAELELHGEFRGSK